MDVSYTILVATNSDLYEFCGPVYFSISLQDTRSTGHFLEVSNGVDLNETLVATVEQVHRGPCLLLKNILHASRLEVLVSCKASVKK